MNSFTEHWICGFVDGEGCFSVHINPSSSCKCGFQVIPEFVVVQHERDINILEGLKNFFNCGVVRRNHGDRQCYRVRSIVHLTEKIIPFFDRNPLKTKKAYDFMVFKEICTLMVKKEHLNLYGVEKIRDKMQQMNRRMHTSKKSP